MNYNTPNETSLLDLIGALKGGMDPNTAYGVYQNVQQDQMQRVANRQDRLGGLAELLSGVAMQGMPQQGAQALAEAQPGPAGPAVQNMLSSLYGDAPQAPQGGYQPELLTGTTPGGTYMQEWSTPQEQKQQANQQYAQSTSPAYQPVPPSPTEQLAMQQAQVEQETAPLWSELVQNAQESALSGQTSKEQFLMDAAKAYPELFASDSGQVFQIINSIFATPTV